MGVRELAYEPQHIKHVIKKSETDLNKRDKKNLIWYIRKMQIYSHNQMNIENGANQNKQIKIGVFVLSWTLVGFATVHDIKPKRCELNFIEFENWYNNQFV